jgi:hypothetical protein
MTEQAPEEVDPPETSENVVANQDDTELADDQTPVELPDDQDE